MENGSAGSRKENNSEQRKEQREKRENDMHEDRKEKGETPSENSNAQENSDEASSLHFTHFTFAPKKAQPLLSDLSHLTFITGLRGDDAIRHVRECFFISIPCLYIRKSGPIPVINPSVK